MQSWILNENGLRNFPFSACAMRILITQSIKFINSPKNRIVDQIQSNFFKTQKSHARHLNFLSHEVADRVWYETFSVFSENKIGREKLLQMEIYFRVLFCTSIGFCCYVRKRKDYILMSKYVSGIFFLQNIVWIFFICSTYFLHTWCVSIGGHSWKI